MLTKQNGGEIFLKGQDSAFSSKAALRGGSVRNLGEKSLVYVNSFFPILPFSISSDSRDKDRGALYPRKSNREPFVRNGASLRHKWKSTEMS